LRRHSIKFIEPDDLIVLKEFVFFTGYRRNSGFEVGLHIFDIEHANEQILVLGHLNKTLGDHCEVLVLNVFPTGNLQKL
jgi:hypothetical protein